MTTIQRIALTVVCSLFPWATVAAQAIPGDRVEVRGGGGWAAFGDDFSSHGAVGGALDVRLAGGLRAGPEVTYYAGSGEDRDVSILGVATYDFRRLQRLVPFVSFAVGILRHTGGDRWSSTGSIGAGGGVKLAVSDRLYIAPEVRAGWDPVVRATVAVGYRF